MPELPEVEMTRLYVQRTSTDQPVDHVSVPDSRVLDGITPVGLGRRLKGTRFGGARRRGKYLLVSTGRGDTCLMHFGMTGALFYRHGGNRKPRFSRVEFYFESGNCLHYTSKRVLGKVGLYQTTEESEIPDVSRLGWEPLDPEFTFERFHGEMEGHRVTIHQALMNQSAIAGIGNLYSDEILFQSGIRPDRSVRDLSREELEKVFEKMKWVLRRSIELGADLDPYPEVFLMPHRRGDGECPRGNGKLARETIGGRSSYFCPVCQK